VCVSGACVSGACVSGMCMLCCVVYVYVWPDALHLTLPKQRDVPQSLTGRTVSAPRTIGLRLPAKLISRTASPLQNSAGRHLAPQHKVSVDVHEGRLGALSPHDQ